MAREDTVSVLVLAYHAIEPGPAPLCLDPGLFREQLDAIVDSGATTLTVSELATALRDGRLPERAVALTFDDGAASVVRTAAPLLAERGLAGTVYCVAGYLGRRNDWPSQRAGAHRFDLAAAGELATSGLEIGSHGFEHEPVRETVATHEVVESKQVLEQALGVPVTSFAYPYGAVGASGLVRETYDAACAMGLATAGQASDPWALPRIDIHYVRKPELLLRAIDGSLGPYLALRRVAARARRSVLRDYA
jgi:peptidoglycan/xylan/chitin deacetylase (PgdA/CDA1 family)